MRGRSGQVRGGRGRGVAAVGALTILVAAVLGVAVPVTSVTGAESAVPAASAKTIAFTSERDGSFDIFVMDEAGGQVTRLTTGADAYDPAWSPDGDRIAFHAWNQTSYDLFVMGADGSNLTNLTATPHELESDAAWSPDGDRIAFAGSADGKTDIFVMAADGSNRVDLTNTPAVYEENPSWSPDGTRIAFDDPLRVWAMDADGTDRVQLTSESGVDPAWSPDGTRIAFQSSRDGPGSEVYVMDADGSDETRLTTSTTKVDVSPGWAPDSARILFASNYHAGTADPDEMDLYVTNLAGAVTRLTNNAYTEDAPSWRVLAQAPMAGLYKSITPVRVLDSRPGSQVGPYASPWGAGQARTLTVAGITVTSAGTNPVVIPAGAAAVALNVTGVFPTQATHLTVWPDEQPTTPLASNLNLPPCDVRPNLVLTATDGGWIKIYNISGDTHVLVDIAGYFE